MTFRAILRFVFICVCSIFIGQKSCVENSVQTELQVNQRNISSDYVLEQKLSKVKLPFIENHGQVNSDVKFYANTFGGAVYVTDRELVYNLPQAKQKQSKDKLERLSIKGVALKEKFVNSKKDQLSPKGRQQASAVVSHFIGNDKSKWISAAKTYNSVELGEPWTGVTLELKAYGNNVEKIFTVSPGTNPEKINLAFEGSAGLNVDQVSGELLVKTELGNVNFTKPVAYQYVNGKRKEVQVAYKSTSDVYGFTVGSYDDKLPLIIDPLLASTFIGGSGSTFQGIGNVVAIDSSGNVFIAGLTQSNVFPTTVGAYDQTYAGSEDVFVSKLNSTLTTLSASTYLGGTNGEFNVAMRIDASGNVVLAGSTQGGGFPSTAGVYDQVHNGSYDVFVSKLNSTLTTLSASTFIGGASDDFAGDLAIDASGNIFVTGASTGSTYPTTAGAYDQTYNDSANGYDAFVSKLNSTLTTLSASTYIGGTEDEFPRAIAIDGSSNVFIAGTATGSTYPSTIGAYDQTYNGGGDVFISKFNSTLTTLSASTFIGGASAESLSSPGNGLALDSLGNVYVAGVTSGADYPITAGVYDQTYNGGGDGFVSKLNSTLTTLSASTYIGGTGGDFFYALSIDSSNNIFVGGYTDSSNYPTVGGAYDLAIDGTTDAIVSKFNTTLTALSASTYLGGSSTDIAYDLAFDSSGNVFVVGETASNNYPTTAGVYDETHSGSPAGDVFVSKLDTGLTGPLDVIAPTVTNVTSSTANGSYNASSVISIQVVFSEVVNVTGVPQLTLETGASNAVVNYSSGTGSNTLTFNYTVAAGHTSSDLDYVGIGSLALNAGTIRDAALNNATLTLSAPGAAGSLGANKAIIVDTTAPATPGVPDLTTATDTGSSNTDNITSDTTPNFTITCESGAAVSLLEGASVLGSGTCAAGTVTITSSALGSGSHSITSRQADAAGNISGTSAALSVTIDITAPLAPGVPDLTSATDTGSSNTDNITSDTTPSFTVSCETGATVSLLEGVTSLGTGVCAAGTVTITSSALASGAHTITASQTDPAGNLSATSAGLSVTIDTAAPVAPGTPDLQAASDTGSSSTDNITSDTTPTFNITCALGNTVNLKDGVTVVGTAICAASPVAIISSALSSGVHSITATQTDAAGNESVASAALSVTIDTTSPVAPGTPDMTAATDTGSSNTDNITSDTTPNFTISCETGATVSLLEGVTSLGTGLCAASTVTITSSALASGAHTITASQTDPAGNLSATSASLAITIDNTAPAAPGAPDLQAASDTGSSSTDNITSDTTPTFDITCLVGNTVNLKDGVTVIGTASCAASPVSIVASVLSSGVHSITATQTDTAGNESIASAALSVTIDTTAPAAPGIPDMTAATDTGSSNTDNLTSDTTPNFTVTCETGATVSLLEGVTSLGTGLCASGTVTITSSALTAGAHTISARQTDPAGNLSSTSAVLSVTIDTSAPAAPGTPDLQALSDTGLSSTDNITSDSTLTFDIACTFGNTVNLKDGITVIGTASCAASPVSIVSSVLSSGVHSITATQTDTAGNESAASAALSVTIDTTAPAATGTPDLTAATDTGLSSTDNITSDTTPNFTISCESGATVSLFDGVISLGTGLCAASTVTITSSALASGVHTITASQTDIAGNTSLISAGLSVTIDTSAPVAPGTPDLQSASDTGISFTDNITSDTTPTFDITCAVGNTLNLKVDGTLIETAGCSASPVTIVTSVLSSGVHLITATQTDAAGNESTSSASLSVTIDTTAPAAPGTPDMTAATDTGSSNTDNITSDTTPNFTISCESGATVSLLEGVTSLGSGICAASTVTITSSALASGAHNITASQTDAAGNLSVTSAGLSVTIDTSAPVAPGTPDLQAASDTGLSSTDNITSDTTPTFDITCAVGNTVNLKDGVIVIGTANCAASPVSIVSSLLSSGVHSITATQTDAAGNESTASAALSVTIDIAAPATPGVPDLTAATDTGSSNTDNLTSDSSPDFTITCESGATVTLQEGVTSLGSGLCVANTVTITSTVLATGVHIITAIQADTAGNISAASAGLSITVDNTAPVAPGVPDLQAASDTGLSSTDNITSDTTPTFDITCAVGNTVNLKDGGIIIGTVLCSASSVSIVSSVLSNGVHSISATQVDSAGNESLVSATLSVTIDTAAPVAPGVPDLTAATDTGSSNTDNLTSDTTPSFTVGCETGATVSLFEGATSLASGLCVSGTVTITSSVLSSGLHTLTAAQVDLAGNVSLVSSGLSITIDTAISVPQISVPTESSTLIDTTPTIDGTADSNASIVVKEGLITLCSTSSDGLGNWTCDSSSLSNGAHSITATATDLAGNQSASSARAFTISSTIPGVSISSIVTSPTNTNPIPITITFSENVTGFIANDIIISGATLNNFNGVGSVYTFDLVPSADGTITVDVPAAVAKDIDNNDNTAASQYSVTYDATAPATPGVPNLTSASDTGSSNSDNITSDSTPDFVVSCESGATVTLLEGAVVLGTGICSGGSVTITSTTLGSGDHVITAYQTDAAGNTSPTSLGLTVTIDTTAPSAPNTAPDLSAGSDSGSSNSDNVTNDNTPDFTGVCTIGDIVTIYVDGIAVSAFSCSTGSFTQTLPSLADGSHSITFSNMDIAGNESAQSPNLTVVIDTGLPVTPVVISPTNNSTVGNITPLITGTAENNITVSIYIDSVFVGTAITNSSGVWIYQVLGTLTEGAHTVYVTSVDLAGNASSNSTTVNFTVSLDSDGDGIGNTTECSGPIGPSCVDSDGDGTDDYLDTDSDNDGDSDQVEGTTDTDGDGIPDRIEPDNRDTDGDGIVDELDPDSDGDGSNDGVECPTYTNCPDADGDLIPDYLDPDSDGSPVGGGDSDNDGIVDQVECPGGIPCPDSDGDMIPNYTDPDSDNDGIPDMNECPDGDPCPDSDNDGNPDYTDTDSDDDGISDRNECLDGIPCPDGDRDGNPDYRDPDTIGDVLPISPTFVKWNTFLNQWNFLELSADGPGTLNVQIKLYNLNGALMLTKNVNIQGNSQIDIDIHNLVKSACEVVNPASCVGLNDIDGNGIVDSYGLIGMTYSGTPRLVGRLTNYKINPGNSTFSFAFARELRTSSIRNTYAVANTFDPQGSGYIVPNFGELIHLGDSLKAISGTPVANGGYTVNIYDIAGSLKQSRHIILKPLQEYDFATGHEFVNSNGKVIESVYLVEVVPDNPQSEYIFSVARYSSNSLPGKPSDLYNYAMAVPSRRGTAEPLYATISNAVNSCGTVTNWVEVGNVTSSPIFVTVRFRDSAGQTISTSTDRIAAKSQYHYNASSQLAPGDDGSVEITSTTIDSVIAQSMVYVHECDANKIQTAYVSVARKQGRAAQVGTLNTFIGMENTVKVISAKQSAQTYNATAVTYDGASYNLNLSLAGRATDSIYAATDIGFPLNRYGKLTLTTTNPGEVVSEVLRVRPVIISGKTRWDFAIPTEVK